MPEHERNRFQWGWDENKFKRCTINLKSGWSLELFERPSYTHKYMCKESWREREGEERESESESERERESESESERERVDKNRYIYIRIRHIHVYG